MGEQSGKGNAIAGAACFGGIIAGTVALVAGLAALWQGQWIAGSVCLTGAAVGFGATANALLRN